MPNFIIEYSKKKEKTKTMKKLFFVALLLLCGNVFGQRPASGLTNYLQQIETLRVFDESMTGSLVDHAITADDIVDNGDGSLTVKLLGQGFATFTQFYWADEGHIARLIQPTGLAANYQIVDLVFAQKACTAPEFYCRFPALQSRTWRLHDGVGSYSFVGRVGFFQDGEGNFLSEDFIADGKFTLSNQPFKAIKPEHTLVVYPADPEVTGSRWQVMLDGEMYEASWQEGYRLNFGKYHLVIR